MKTVWWMLFLLVLCGVTQAQLKKNKKMEKVMHTEEEWKKLLTPLQFNVLREKGTERAFTGLLTDNFEEGTYLCAACGNILFSSKQKFHSGCGWPSFSEVASKGKIIFKVDKSFGMVRTEVQCALCESHLGHVFNDGPPPSGMRYCINSESLIFIKKN